MFKDKVKELVQEALDENPSLFLITLDIQGNNEIKIVIDGDEGVRVEDCMSVSRKVEHNLDREEEDFSLEVMSSGATSPLEIPRQFIKNVGRHLAVKTQDGEKIEGLMEEATDSKIVLTWKTREPKPVGKGKVTVHKKVALTYPEIAEAKVMIKF